MSEVGTFLMNRMLCLIKNNVHTSNIHLTPQFFQDLSWFNVFLDNYNGVIYYDSRPVDESIHLDACFTGLGSVFQTMVYTLVYTFKIWKSL